jgi:hypothetical protein
MTFSGNLAYVGQKVLIVCYFKSAKKKFQALIIAGLALLAALKVLVYP